MKRIGFSGLFYMALFGAGGYAGLEAYRFYVPISHSYVLSDRSDLSMLSAHCRKRLHTFFVTHRSSNLLPADLFTLLKNEFPMLKKVSLAYKKQKTEVTIQGIRPLFVFNNKTVIGEQKRQVPQVDFSRKLVTTLPHFSVALQEGSQDFSEETIEYASGLNPALYEYYDIAWEDASRIVFHDKKYPHITLLAAVDTGAEKLLQPACREMVATLLERKPSRNGQKNDWCIDMRFKGQMIVFPGGRVTYEKGVCG